MRFLFGSLLLAFVFQVTEAQIVNIESQRIQSDTTGWLGTIGTSFLFEKNAVEVLNIGAMAHIEYKTPKSIYLFLVDYNLLQGSSQTFDDNLFYHLRYNYRINSWLRWEIFTQYQQNKLTGIKQRWLGGTGPRFKLASGNHISLYAATAAMYEYEIEKTEPPVYLEHIRSSSYVSFSYKPAGNAEIISTFFYQPLFNNFGDYRLLNEISIKFKLIKHVAFTTGWSYLYDSRPVATIPKSNYSIRNGISYTF